MKVEVGEGDGEIVLGEGQGLDGVEARFVVDVELFGFGIDEPDMGDAPGEVLGEFLEGFAEAVVWRGDLYGDERWGGWVGALGELAGKDGNVGDAIEGVGLEGVADFRYDFEGMQLSDCTEEYAQQGLNFAVEEGRHGALQDLAVDVFTVKV